MCKPLKKKKKILICETFGSHFFGQFMAVLYCVLSEIILPSTYRHSVRGLCGNYDGITRNEYMKPDGTVVRNVNDFGESWRVGDRQGDGARISNLPFTVHAHRSSHGCTHYNTYKYVVTKCILIGCIFSN